MLKSILYAILRPLDRLLKLLVPTTAARICYQSLPDYSDNAYYVYRHALRTRNNIGHVWLVTDLSLASRIQREFREHTSNAGTTGNSIRIVSRKSLRGYLLFLTSRYVFHTHGVFEFSDWMFRRTVVSLWHGMPIKCVARLNKTTPNPWPTFGTVHLATSHLFKYIVASAFGVEPDAVHVGKLPRCDAFLRDAASDGRAVRIRELLGIPVGKRMVLWMPTHRTDTRSFLDDVQPHMLQALGRAAESSNCVVLVKLHPLDKLNDAAFSFQDANLVLLKSPAWLRHEIDLYDLVAASDGLISDVSSILVDYLVTNKPMGVLGFDTATYTRDLTLPMELIMRSSRYIWLRDDGMIAEFFSRVRDARRQETPPGDIAELLYERFEEMGAEAILRHVRL